MIMPNGLSAYKSKMSGNVEKLLGITVEQIHKDICVLGKLHPEESEDSEKNYLEEIQVHEQQEWDSEYVHLKTEEKRWFHNIAICCEINGKKIYGFLSKPIVIEELIGILQHNLV